MDSPNGLKTHRTTSEGIITPPIGETTSAKVQQRKMWKTKKQSRSTNPRNRRWWPRIKSLSVYTLRLRLIGIWGQTPLETPLGTSLRSHTNRKRSFSLDNWPPYLSAGKKIQVVWPNCFKEFQQIGKMYDSTDEFAHLWFLWSYLNHSVLCNFK